MLADLQWNYRGLTFGAGTEFHVNRAEGFEGFEVRSDDAELPRGDGAIRGLDFVAPRTLAFELALIEYLGGSLSYEAAWAAVRSAFRPARERDYPLTFKRPGQPERVIWCRPVQLARTEEFRRYNALGFPPIALRAVDPRIYSSEVREGVAQVYAVTGGGINFPSNFNVNFAGGTKTELVVENDGTADAYPLIRFYGASVGTVNGVTLTNTTTGQQLVISASVTSGQILTADMAAAVTGTNGLVVSIDGASRYGDWELPREPFAIAPGSNTLRFEVDGSATTALCALTWRSTWLD